MVEGTLRRVGVGLNGFCRQDSRLGKRRAPQAECGVARATDRLLAGGRLSAQRAAAFCLQWRTRYVRHDRATRPDPAPRRDFWAAGIPWGRQFTSPAGPAGIHPADSRARSRVDPIRRSLATRVGRRAATVRQWRPASRARRPDWPRTPQGQNTRRPALLRLYPEFRRGRRARARHLGHDDHGRWRSRLSLASGAPPCPAAARP